MMALSEAAVAMHGVLCGDDTLFKSVSQDTRTLQKEALYVAIHGERYDGIEFVEASRKAGAAGALVDAPPVGDTAMPYIQVSDTRIALGELASYWREKSALRVIAVTGSNGKTTVKDMCRAILSSDKSVAGTVLGTTGNLNNDIGMPLTLLGIRECHRYAVIEMGANHVGEIEYLTRICRPDVAIITNAGPAHLEGFGTVSNVATAKGEIFSGLSPDGIAIINADDTYADYWQSLCSQFHVVTFSLESDADISGKWTAMDNGGQLVITARLNNAADAVQGKIDLWVPGIHNARNALAATAATLMAGANMDEVNAGLSGFRGVSGRLEKRPCLNNANIIDDSYNANPQSLAVAIDVLSEIQGERWLVLGDMAELGDDAHELHHSTGAYAKEKGIDYLFSVGDLSSDANRAFGENSRHFENKQLLISHLRSIVYPGVTLLVKGSRTAGMEEVVNALAINSNAEAEKCC